MQYPLKFKVVYNWCYVEECLEELKDFAIGSCGIVDTDDRRNRIWKSSWIFLVFLFLLPAANVFSGLRRWANLQNTAQYRTWKCSCSGPVSLEKKRTIGIFYGQYFLLTQRKDGLTRCKNPCFQMRYIRSFSCHGHFQKLNVNLLDSWTEILVL